MIEHLKSELRRQKKLTLPVKVIPKSARNEIVGFLEDGTLKLKIAAAPEKGKANAEVCALLAEVFGVSRKNIEIARGEKSQLKLVVISL
ncbi:MAG: DUF167 domain-containing protein [Bryobacteraceae bacterium]